MTITEYILNVGLVALVALQIKGHKVTVARMLFPVVVTIWVASQFLHSMPTAGNDVLLDGALGLVGLGLGVAAGVTTTVRRAGVGAFAKAGLVAAVLWVLGIGARVGFSVWVGHGGRASVATFSAAHHITSGAAWSTAFVLMAMAEVVSRTGVLYLRTVRTGAEIPRGGLRTLLASA